MAARSTVPTPAELRTAVDIRLDGVLSAELAARAGRSAPQPTLGVTDLVASRRAYWRRVGPPIPISAERTLARERGQYFHTAVGRALARDGPIEVRVRRDGIAGRVDALAAVPTEVKTGAELVEPDHLRRARPDHLEQLAMYCGLLDRSEGRLLYLRLAGSTVDAVRAIDIEVRDRAGVAAELLRRAAELRASLLAHDPSPLPRCRWFGRGCEFEQAGVCGCSGSEPIENERILDAVGTIAERTEVAARVAAALPAGEPDAESPAFGRYRDLLYPRRAFFERTVPHDPEQEPPPRPPSGDTYQRLLDVVESGPTGEVAGLATVPDAPTEDVVGFRGAPVLLRTSRAWDPIAPEELMDRSPQYVLDIGLRCVATGATSGRVIVAYERAVVEADRFAVYEIGLRTPTPFSRLWRERSGEIRRAIASGTASLATACPAWMAEDCPYAAVCGCGDAGRSQR